MLCELCCRIVTRISDLMPASNAIHMWESSVQTSDVTGLFFHRYSMMMTSFLVGRGKLWPGWKKTMGRINQAFRSCHYGNL